MKITLKRSNVLEGSVAKPPTAAQMEYGEFAVNYNTADPSVFIKDSGNEIVKIAGQGSIGGRPAGINTSVQYNDNGLFGGGSTFTFSPSTNTLSAPIGNFITGLFTNATVTGTTDTQSLLVNSITLQGSNPYMLVPSDGKIMGTNGSLILVGNQSATSGTSVSIENTGISYKYNGNNPIKFEYTPGSNTQTYRLPTGVGQLSYVLGLTDVASGQMGWIGMVPLGEWTEELIPTLT